MRFDRDLIKIAKDHPGSYTKTEIKDQLAVGLAGSYLTGSIGNRIAFWLSRKGLVQIAESQHFGSKCYGSTEHRIAGVNLMLEYGKYTWASWEQVRYDKYARKSSHIMKEAGI